MAVSFIRAHPELRPFLLQNARPTGVVIGDGSYGSVVELEIPGTKCAAKKIHDFFLDPTRMPREGIEKTSSEFVRECQLMSTLRHPHIVQFLGVCFLPGSRMPALVMEKLLSGLHEILDPEPPPRTKAYIPLSLKCSVLHDVASGLSFLHSHTPPIIHRDLSARNVLLSVGMVAKIADLGMARIVPSLRAATMTKVPGASIYMPPEALEDVSKYDITIDIFSIGVVAIFVLSQTFPKPLAAAYMDARRRMVGRTELERRGEYMQQIQRQLREDHPLIKVIQRCLSNLPQDRPTVDLVLDFLEQARAEVNDSEYDTSKLALAQALSQKTQLLQGKDELVEQKTREIQTLNQQVVAKDEQIESQKERVESQRKRIESQRKRIESQREQFQSQMRSMGRQIETLQAEIAGLQRKVQRVSEGKPQSSAVEDTMTRPLKWPLKLQWRKGKDIPTILFQAHTVTINGMVLVYCGGSSILSTAVLRYNPESDEWTGLPDAPVKGFAMTSLSDQLVLVGDFGDDNYRITVWDRGCSKWVHPYPPMPTGRSESAAIGYRKYLIVACGYWYSDKVEVLDSSSGRWYSAQPVPVRGHQMSSVVVDDYWYLSSFGWWEDVNEHIFRAHLPTLISSAMSASTSTASSIWHELPTPPVEQPTLLALHGHLLLIGGKGYVLAIHRYDTGAEEWKECGQLPVGMDAPCCTALPSGELMVAGGLTRHAEGYSKRVWIGKITDN